MNQQTKSKVNKAISNGVSTNQSSPGRDPAVAGQNKSWIVCLSTFPPRQCGIATFTADLTNAIDQMFGPSVKSKIVAMNLTELSHFPYPDKVILQISQPREEDYVNAANKLNQLKEVKLVNIQHEFGIFGGEYGSHLLLLLEKLQKPIVTTLHTVLPAPDEKMRTIVQTIMKYSKGIIVMTHSSREILVKDYGLDHDRIQVISHGIHHVPYRTSEHAKSFLGISHKLILSTFGLLNPGKGIEYVIDALPKVVEKFPNVRFLVAGVTHPVVLEQEGETYRNFLIKKVYELNLADYVSFYNTYFDQNDLLRFLEATDVYLSPSLNLNQTVSGTLSYALGSGRPVISTAFAQAKEDIADEVGILIDFKKPQAFTDAIIKLLGNDRLRLQMGKNAYFRTRHMTWQNVSLSYLKYFSQFAPELTLGQRKLPPIKLEHLAKLTDNFGIIQFAKLTEPDLSSGYTLDDNARSLIAAVFHYEKFRIHSALKLASIYLNFLYRVAKPDGYFDNYVNSNRAIDKQRNIQENSEDPSARALYALALVSTTKQIPKRIRHQAHSLFEKNFQKNIAFSSPRAIAFYIKAFYCLLSKWPGLRSHFGGVGKEPKTLAVLRSYCEQLIILYEKSHSPEWEWFEHYLTYSNAILSEALLLGYKITGERRYLEVAEKTLNFLIKHTFKDDMYIPIGQSGWFPKEGTRQHFDQQPEDVAATVGALNAMFQVTNRKHYKELANIAFNWFLGDNVLGQVVYDRTTGGCYDGVGEKFINLNQGAESTISYLLARFSVPVLLVRNSAAAESEGGQSRHGGTPQPSSFLPARASSFCRPANGGSNQSGFCSKKVRTAFSNCDENMPEKLNLESQQKEVSPEETARLRQENELLRTENEELKHDSLTGLLDHRQFYQELFRVAAEEKDFSVAMIDLNYLNYFNDINRGHKGGDEALKNLVQALQKTEGSFTPYRYGGDEFSLIVRGSKKEAQEILEQIKNRLTRIKIEGAELPLTISSGLATREEAVREIARLSAEEKTGKSQKQLLAETIADLADRRSLTAKRENHREMLLGLCRQPDEEKLDRFCHYLLKGAGMTIKELQKMRAENPQK